MKLTSVNVATPQPIDGKSGLSGIFKLPQSGPVAIHPLGLENDAIVDTENHGGLDQAVYIYGLPDYDWWAEQLGHEVPPGTFGENLTFSELASASIRVGDQFEIGEVLLEVTYPRIPCVTLARRMNDPKFVKKFHKARRPGIYARVLREGSVAAGMDVLHRPADADALLAVAMM